MDIWILATKEHTPTYSGTRLTEEAKKQGITLSKVAPEELDLIVTKDGKRSIILAGKSTSLPDCVIPRIGAEATYFSLAVLRHLEMQGVVILNNARSIELARDKLATIQALKAHNLPIPKTMLAKLPLNLDIIREEFTFPIILKTVSGSKGKGVFLCETKVRLSDFMGLIEASKDAKLNLILQEFISSSKGRDIRILVIGGKPIGAILRKAKKGQFRANFSMGGDVEPYPLTPALEWIAIEAARVMGLDIAGVDLLFDGDTYAVTEVNASPGFEGFEKATNIDVAKIMIGLCRLRCPGAA
ncbi:TPA: RimK family alpha-L-glutamate ligase [Candidatus Woesearchaeota archaeon]|nr:RimK family alpha-L-glutamate ligase [Candidatus Woesearchaeota archaeon]